MAATRTWVTTVIAAAALPAAVLAVDPSGLSPFGPVKWLLVPSLVLAAAASLDRVDVDRGLAMQWAGFLAVAVVASALAVDPVYAWIGTPERHFGLFTWMLCAVAFAVGHRVDVGTLATAAAVTVGGLGIWIALESAGWEPIPLVGAGDRAVGTLGSSAYVGAAAVLLTPLAMTAGRGRWLAAGGVVAVAASGARAAWVAGVIIAVASVAAGRVRWRAVMVGAVAFVAVAGLTGTVGRAPDVVTDERGGVAGRLDEWRVAARAVGDRPIFGAGPEGYRIVFGAAVDDRYEIEHGRTPLPDRAHSSALDVAVTTGTGGLLVYLLLVGAIARLGLRALRAGSPRTAAIAAGVLAYWLQSLFLFPIAELDPLAWILAGHVAAAAPAGRRWQPRLGRVLRGVFACAAIVAVVAGGLDVVADRAAKRSLGDGSDPDAARRLRPDVARYHLAAARLAEQRGDLHAAIRALEDGLDVTPRDPILRAETARLELGLGRREGDLSRALRILEELAHDDPRNAEVLLRLGVARALADDSDGAEEAWLDAERLAPRSASASTNLAVAYLEQGRLRDAAEAARRALARDPAATRAREVLDELSGT